MCEADINKIFYVHRQRSIFTSKKTLNCSQLSSSEVSPQSNAPPFVRYTHEYLDFKVLNKAKGDDSQSDIFKSCEKPLDMKSLKAEIKSFNANVDAQDEPNSEIDMRHVTVRPPELLYFKDVPVNTSLGDQISIGEPTKVEDIKPDPAYFTTPTNIVKTVPRRKLSVYNGLFDIDSLQNTVSFGDSSWENKRSSSTPDVQEKISKSKNKLSRNQLTTNYRCPNETDDSLSPSPSKTPLLFSDEDEDSLLQKLKSPKESKPVILAPSKLKFAESKINQTPNFSRSLFGKNCEKSKTQTPCDISAKIAMGNEEQLKSDNVQKSRIISSSNDVKVNKEENKEEELKDQPRNSTRKSCNIDCSMAIATSEISNISPMSVSDSSNLEKYLDISENMYLQGHNVSEHVYEKNGEFFFFLFLFYAKLVT